MKIVRGFEHQPGLHCGSTAMRDLLHHLGVELSEAMCFGLGSGLGFVYFRDPTGSPSHFIIGRTLTLERDLCDHLGLIYAEARDADSARAWNTARELLDRDVPVLLQVELARLPYYQTRTSFPLHRIVLAGYDDARGVALVADTHFAGLQEIAYDDLRAARSAPNPLFTPENDWVTITRGAGAIDLPRAIITALRDNALAMNADRAPFGGVRGMETLAEEFEDWAESADWVWCARFTYQMIERRGTGGGFFRKIYAAYLREAEELIPALQSAHLAEAMAEIAGEWTELAGLLKRISEEQDARGFAEAARRMKRLAGREESFWGRVNEWVNE